jgi:hypothetical protein
MAKEKSQEVKKVVCEEGQVLVTSTVLGKTSVIKNERIPIRPFVTEPASVEIMFGTWFPTGDMAGVKVDVRLRVPCYKEELAEVFTQVRDEADKLLDREIARLRGEEIPE